MIGSDNSTNAVFPDATVSVATHLAVERTRLAVERTMMAWVRTATSLILFGFSIYKFFQIRQNSEAPDQLIGPREFALIMISIGLTSLLLATLQHWQSMRNLRALHPGLRVPRSLAVLVGGLISIAGILALFAVLLRH